MALSKRQVSRLQKIVDTLQAILAEANESSPAPKRKVASRAPAKDTRSRRSGKELVAFRKVLRAERKSGVPVAEISKRHNISKAYIYQL